MDNSKREMQNNYVKLLFMFVVSFLIMYLLMYSMVDRFPNVVPNLNQIYMALLMSVPMALLEIVMMHSMYENSKFNLSIGGVSLLIFLLSFIFIRNQTGINDTELLKSMIPHHSGAILMCEKAKLTDPEVKDLCNSIIDSQQREIDMMQNKLKDINK